ncbi:MAG: PKD domain-containing protein [Burkholderiaceae bacterium]|nr:PKD domain-containing protein [Burkholderiaceae bacterium]
MKIRALCLAWFLALVSTVSWAADLTVGTYTLVSSKRVSLTDYEIVYKAQVTNTGPALRSVVGTVVSTNPATMILEGTLSFGDVAAGGTVTSVDTFTLRHNRSQPFDASRLIWTVNGTPATPIQSDFTVSPPGGNAPVTIRFTPTPITNTAINRFEWDFDGNGSIDVVDTVGRDQTRTYSTPGTFAVSLKITDSQGRTDTRVKNVVIGNAPPSVTAAASPTNGQVPLTVNFTASATDSNGVVRFEWDFDGDGTFDRVINGSSGNTTFAYTAVGTFVPKLRVTDGLGASTLVSVPTMEVRAAPVGSAQATLSLSRTSGPAPLAVTLSASASNLLGRTVQNYQWDPDGNGSFDATTTTNSFAFTYPGAGTFYPRVRINLSDGSQADDVKQVSVTATASLALNTDTLDAQLAQTVSINTTLSAATRVSVVVETRGGTAVRTVLPFTDRAAGSYTDSWDGKDGGGQYVPEGIYKAVLLYELNGVPQRLDLSTTTGGQEYNPSRTSIPSTFEPYNYRPLTIDFSLTRASEVTAFMGSFNVDTRYVTFYTRQAFGRGTHRITWNGDNAEGQIIKPAPGDAFLFGIFGYTLPNNGIFVRNGVQLSAMSAAPPIFDPTGLTAAAQPNKCAVQFTLSLPATAELVVQDSITGAVVSRLQYPGLPAGANTVLWDGKTSDGRYAAPGTYRLGVTAIQANGFRSLSSYVLQRVYY